MKKVFFAFSVLVLTGLLLAACGPKSTGTSDIGTTSGLPTTTGNSDSGTTADLPKATNTTVSGTTTGLPNLNGRTVTVAVENGYPPFNSIDQATGQGIGWDYDAFKEICRRLNCVADFKQSSWDGIFPAMAAGEYDVLADGATSYPYRYWAVDFSVPYALVSQQLLVRANETNTLEQFKSKATLKVGTQIGTTNYIAATEFFPGKQIQSYSDFGASVLALLAGDIDGIVLDDTAAFGFMQANLGKLKTIGAVKTGDALAFAFPPYSDLEFAVNAALRAMRADGTLLQINRQWGLSDPPEGTD